MGVWKHSINLYPEFAPSRDKDFLTDDDAVEVGLAVADKLLREAKNLKYRNPHWCEALTEFAHEFGCADTVEDFDQILEDLYDFGDRERIIINTLTTGQ